MLGFFLFFLNKGIVCELVCVVWGRWGRGEGGERQVRSLLWGLRSARCVRVFVFSLVVHPVVSRRRLFCLVCLLVFCLVLFFLLRIEQVEF